MLCLMCGAANSGRCAGGFGTCAGSWVFPASTSCHFFVFRGFIIAKFSRLGKRFFLKTTKDQIAPDKGENQEGRI